MHACYGSLNRRLFQWIRLEFQRIYLEDSPSNQRKRSIYREETPFICKMNYLTSIVMYAEQRGPSTVQTIEYCPFFLGATPSRTSVYLSPG